MKRIYKLVTIPVTHYADTPILTTPCPAGNNCMVASGACNDCPSRADYRRIDVDTIQCSKRIRNAPAKLYSNAFSGE